MTKLRMKTWYWGNYVTKPLPNTSKSDYELYDEQIHGWHNSEEYKTGYKLTPYNNEEQHDFKTKKEKRDHSH